MLLFLLGFYSASAQSTEQQFPTPLRIPELEGTILPRSIGDARTTTHFYTFEGSSGDLFLNIVTTNLNADIDLFVEEGLRPLTKIVVYADRGETETGRVIYLRKPEKLLLRVQGRTLNDDPGRYRLKFAGGFVAAAADIREAPQLPRAIVDQMPVTVTKSREKVIAEKEEVPVPEPRPTNAPVSTATETQGRETERVLTPNVVVTEGVLEKRSEPVQLKDKATDRILVEERTKGKEPVGKPDPMAQFELIVRFRDGSMITRPMIEVQRFQVDKGVLMILNRNGSVSRYSMADVENVMIQ
jgi:hypothetical protein